MGTTIGNSIKLQLSGASNTGYIGPVGTAAEFVSGAYSIDVADYSLTLYGSSSNGGTLPNLFLTFTDLGNLPDFTSVTVTAGTAPSFSWDANSITVNMSSIALPAGIVFRLGIGFSPTDISLSNTTIDENATAQSVVGTLSNDDFDGTTRTYAIAENPYFAIDGSKIVLKAGVSLDYETMTSYDVTVTATDSSGAKDSVTETFTIAVRDVNEQPSLTATGLQSTFTENGAPVDLFSGVSVGTVEAGQTIKSLVLRVAGLDASSDSDWLDIDGTPVALVNASTGSTLGHNVTYSVSRSGNVATVTLVSSGGLTAAQAELLIDGLAYTNDGNDPDATDRTITISSIRDSGGTANGGIDTTMVAISSTVHVVPVNDAPDGTDKTITITEDTSYTFSAADFGFSDALDGDSFLALRIATLPRSGTLLLADTTGGSASPTVVHAGDEIAANDLRFLTWTPDRDANGSGVAALTFQVIDSGGSSSGSAIDPTPSRITFDVTAVNDAPHFTAGADQTVAEDSGAHTVTAWATGIAAGPGDEGGQALAFTVTNDNNGLFAVQPMIGADGTLTYTLADDADGAAMVTVVLTDNGGMADGGKDASNSVSFLITATAINDAPTQIDITPVAPNTGTSFVVAENSAGAAIGTVLTTDRDDSAFTYTIDDNRFEIVGDQLKLKSGVALDYESAQQVTIKITAMDSGGLTVSRSIGVTVTDDAADNNSAPQLTSPNADATVQSGAALSLIVGDGHFLDPEGSDLDYTLTVNGGAQPAWLSFDAETGLLTGRPSSVDAGTYVIAVTANDGSLFSVTDTFDLIVTGPGSPPDTIGTRGKDILIGDDSDNEIDGRRGNDRLTGNGGADTFVFGKHYGRDVITDFDPGEGDRIDLSDAIGIRGFQDLMKNHVTDIGDDIRIRADDGSVLVIRGIEPGELTKDMMLF